MTRAAESLRPATGVTPVAYVVAAAATVALLACSGRYGPHRDELYFVAAGHHPQWGYPDQPPLTPLVAVAADALAHGSLLALRALSAVVVGAVTVLTVLLARDLGGGRRAQLLTAVATATGAGLLAVGHLLSTTTLDLLFWTLVVRLTVVTLRSDRPRGWLLVGLAVGAGLENKHLVAFAAAALVLGVALTPAVRHHLTSPWAYAGAALSVAFWLPNVIWQARHGWPQLTLASDVRAEYGGLGGGVQLLVMQVLLLGPVAFGLVVTGVVALLRRRDWAFARPVAVGYLALMPVFLLTGGKGYYLLGLLPPCAAAGAVVVEQRWRSSGVTALTVAVAVGALFPVPAVLPVLAPHTYASSFYPSLDDNGMDTIGWPRFVAGVRRVVGTLPAEQRRTAVVVTSNYGEAGALRWYGGLPRVHSGHNGFGDWGPPTSTGPVVYVGERPPPTDALASCRRAATLRTGVDNEEQGAGAWVCSGPVGSWDRAWRRLRFLRA